jgi:DNA-binding NarL/FixJ family response regulator
MKQYCRVILADDHSLFRHGLKRIISENPDLEVVGEVGDGLQLLESLKTADPHVIVLDISMPNLSGIEAIHEIKRMRPNAKVLMLTMHKDPDYLFQAISAGANGYLLKEDAEQELFSAINVVKRGDIYLSPLLTEEACQDWAEMRRGIRSLKSADTLTLREREVLKLITDGKSNKEIGKVLSISHRTVERHRANIKGKLKTNKTADLVKYALQKGYS